MRIAHYGLLSFIALILAGCSAPADNANKTNTADTVKIGVIAPLSGPAATYGMDILQGYNYIVDQANAAGGIDGKQIKLVIEDGRCNGKDAVVAVQKLVNVDKVQVIAGGACSSETLAAGKIAQEAGVVMVSSLSSSPEISSLGDYIFRYRNDADATTKMTATMQANNVETIAIINENTDYAVAYVEALKEKFTGNILFEEKYISEEKDFGILAKKVAENQEAIDRLVFIPQSDESAEPFFRALEQEGILESMVDKILGAETAVTNTMIENFGQKIEGLRGVRFPELDAFGADVQSQVAGLLANYEVQSAPMFIVLAADSMQLILDTVRAVGYESIAIRDHIAAIDSATPRQSLFGNFYFDAEGDGQGLPFVIVEIRDGQMKTVIE